MKSNSRKVLISVLCCAAILSSLITGCGGQSATTDKSNGEAGLKDPSTIKGTITYWYNQDWDTANKLMFDKFQKAYPNIKVSFTSFTYDILIEKIRAAYSANQESDVQQIFGDWATDLMKNQRLAEVPAEMAGDIKNRLFDTTLAGYSYKGKLYGIPREYNIENGGILYYPEDLKAVGYPEFPKTFDELIDAAKKMTKYDSNGNSVHWGFDFIAPDNITYLFLSLILQQDATYWNEDKVHVKFTTPEAEKAMQTMADLVMKYKVTEIKHVNDANNESHVAFFKGLSSMCMRGPWVIPVGLNDFKLTNFKYGTMPSFTGKSQAFAAESGWGEVVSAKSKNKDAAWAFLKYVTNTENNQLWNETTTTIPSEKTISESPAFVEKSPMIKVSLDVLPFGQPIGPLQSIDTFKSDMMINNFVKLCSGEQDVKTALKNIEEQTNTMIDEKIAQ